MSPVTKFESSKEVTSDKNPTVFRELIYPTYVLDLMVVCWAQHPRDRPSASQVVSIASAPEFVHLGDVVSLADYGSCCAQVQKLSDSMYRVRLKNDP